MASLQGQDRVTDHAPKKSFAAVAAMNVPKQNPAARQRQPETKTGKFVKPAVPLNVQVAKRKSSSNKAGVEQLNAELSSLSVDNTKPGSATSIKDVPQADFSGIQTPKSDLTESQISTKPPSPSGKSVASGTTFDMVEKESLLPDDSASVNVTEEDEMASCQASNVQDSGVPSETSGGAFGDQLKEVAEHLNAAPIHGGAGLSQALDGQSGRRPSLVPTQPAAATTSPSQEIWDVPDEKLISALENHQDRAWILELETNLRDFVQGKRPDLQHLEVRSGNSFYRLLAHRLADYYGLQHHNEPWRQDTIKLLRTNQTRLPKLLDLHRPAATPSEAQSSATPSMKIIRRVNATEVGEKTSSGPTTSTNSGEPSKSTSETGDDTQPPSGLVSPTESSTVGSKAPLSREEREAKYQETRDRIFKDFKPSESADPSQNSSEQVSRANSALGNKKKSRKPRRDSSDDFQGRSAYGSIYPGQKYTMTPTPTQYVQTGMQPPYGHPYYQDPNSQAMYIPSQQYILGMVQSTNPQQQQQQQPQYVQWPVFATGQPPSTQQTGQHYPYGQVINQNAAIVSGVPGPVMAGQMYTGQQIPMQQPTFGSSSAPTSRPMSQMSNQSGMQFGYVIPNQYLSPQQPQQQQQQQFQQHAQMMQYPQQPQQDPRMAQSNPQASQYTGQMPAYPTQPTVQIPQPQQYAMPSVQQYSMQNYQYIPQTSQDSQMMVAPTAQMHYPTPYSQLQRQQNTPRQIQSLPATYHNQQQVPAQQAHSPAWTQVPGAIPAVHGIPPQQMQGQRFLQQQQSGYHSLPATPRSGGRVANQNQGGLAKFPTPASLPQKPPPTAQSVTATLPANAGQSVPSFQNGMYAQPQ